MNKFKNNFEVIYKPTGRKIIVNTDFDEKTLDELLNLAQKAYETNKNTRRLYTSPTRQK